MVKKRVTIKEAASSANVSYQTVSKVLNNQIRISNETEKRIWKAVQELGYRPSHTARSLRSQRSQTLGYSWPPSPPDQANPILDQFLQSMFEAAEKRGYYLLCFPYHSDLSQQLAAYGELIDTGRVDGFILTSVDYDDPRVFFLVERNFPFAAFGRSNLDIDFPWIDVDGAAGIHLVVNHLLELGHRKIAILAWPENSRVGNNRMEGYYNSLKDAGIEANPKWIMRGEGRVAFGFQAAQELLALPIPERPTAIVALNDPMAIGAMWAARAGGLHVGSDLAVAGFDDSPMVQYLDPPLTSVRQPIWEIGQRIIPMLLERIESENTLGNNELLVNPRLIIRASTLGKNAAYISQGPSKGGDLSTIPVSN